MKKSRGYTLLELVLVIALIGLTGAALGGTIILGATQMLTFHSRYAALTEARATMEAIMQEIKQIEGPNDVILIGSNSFGFEYPDLTYRLYWLFGSNFRRNLSILASNVNDLDFEYFDRNGNAVDILHPEETLRVQITLSIRAANNNGIVTLRSQIFLRNTGNDYSNFTIQP